MIGSKVKKFRLEINLSQSELARRAGVTSAAISLIEKNNRSVSLHVAQKIAKAFNITLDDLVSRTNRVPKDIINIFHTKWKKINSLNDKDQKLIESLIERLKNGVKL